MKAPIGRLSSDGLPMPADAVGHAGAVAPKSFLWPPNFVVLSKICFKHLIKIKIFPHKNVFPPPQTLKPGYGPGSAKIVSVIRIFQYETYSASRCSITQLFFMNHH